MNYLIFEDPCGNMIPILFPDRILHQEMREQVPYSRVVSGGNVFLKEDKFVCEGKVKELGVCAREEDGETIYKFFLR